MKQTAVEWLLNELIFKQEYEHLPNNYFLMSDKDIDNIIEQAKEMEKQQIIDAAERWKGTDFAEKYYAETYGSKGSDECYFESTTNTSSATICKHCGREKFMHTELQQINQDNPVTRGSTALVPISSQTEISDEEIERWVASTPYYGHCTPEYKEGLEEGAKWYREQLKQRTCR